MRHDNSQEDYKRYRRERFVRPGIEFTDFANRKWEVEQVLATSAICHRSDGPRETRAFPITSILIYLGHA